MNAVLLFPYSGITSNTWWASAKTTVHGRDGPLHHVSCSTLGQEGNRRGRSRRNVSPDKAEKEKTGRLKDLSTSDNEMTSRPSNQDDIIALFRRIQSSISKGRSEVSGRRKPSISRGKQSSESIVGTLKQYPREKPTKARTQTLQENQGPSQSSGTLEYEALRDVKMSRPPSNFIKRSPIPPLPLKENAKEVVEKKSLEVVEDKMLERMKLIELKELAKTKGVKGYSKLKKGELLELLKKLLQSPT